MNEWGSDDGEEDDPREMTRTSAQTMQSSR